MPAEGRAEPFVVGANHRSSTVALRDRMFIDEAKAPLVFEQLAESGIEQALLMSTCDRVEVQAVSKNPDGAAQSIRGMLARMAGIGEGDLADQVYCLSGAAAVRHIFAVASSLDSQTIGEPQVLGQMKESHRLARSSGMIGAELESVLQSAYVTAKRVRSETEIGHRPVSIAAAAGRIARDVQGDLGQAALFVVGLADMGDIIVDQLRAAGVKRVTLCGPSRRTAAAARRNGYNFVSFEALEDSLKAAEIIVTAVGTGQFLITPEMMEGALRRRRWRPVLLIDAGVPGDIDPAVGALDGAFLYTLDDLERVAMEGRSTRGAAAGTAWRIVDEEVASWRRAEAARDAAPAITALRTRFEAVRAEILDDTPDADARDATRQLINRLLHQPSRAMRSFAEQADEMQELQEADRLLRRLFDLGGRED
ncbi:MAG: Glutamyl-tRNA reductase [Alphaproteobacteria bacterium MarineAlpha10_Bin3]|jgi:glutamyl-tRNA reductase|nr:MAG: Glutamyl-tRNA reductase [Alphaproteobacteria bacterium MarineAlpha10_Bin3]PPR75509.1 MAG: Glutamyl-tRNA reductase [Alphaproteobacteria bacterium MarineAlpha4_Bin1]